MVEIIPMTEEQKFQLEIYKLVMNQNAAAEEAFQFISTDELKLELFKIHFQSGGANSDITTRTIEAVRKSKEALDLLLPEHDVSRVINLGKEKKFPITQELYERLEIVIHDYDGEISLCEAIGTLELLKQSLIESAKESST